MENPAGIKLKFSLSEVYDNINMLHSCDIQHVIDKLIKLINPLKFIITK